jgi:hypothetical protein
MKNSTRDTHSIQPLWGKRALEHARTICTRFPGRGSATPSEAQTAEYVHTQLSRLEITDVRILPFQGLRSIWLFLSLAFGLALVGHAAFWLLRSPAGVVPTLLVSILAFALSIFLMWRKFTFQDYPLRRSLPHGDSQNVTAVIPPMDSSNENHHPPQQVVLIAHLDSHRAVWWFATDFLVKLYALVSPVAVFGLILSPLAYLLAVITNLELLAWINLPMGGLHFLAWFTGVTADLGPYSPGANDNAAAVGLVLSVAERLKQQPLTTTKVWLAFTGCEETGCDGILKLLDEYGDELKDALFVDFELVGIGTHLAYIQREGVIHKTHIPVQVERMLQRFGEAYGIKPIDAGTLGAFTEMGAVWEHGYQGACLLLQPDDSPSMPEWHRLTDLPDRLQPEALKMAHNFTWTLLTEIDTDLKDQRK